jgi:hypothetical protein
MIQERVGSILVAGPQPRAGSQWARCGTRLTDLILRTTGAVALGAIPVTLYVPATGPMIGFLLVTVWVNGPISPLLPSTYEPILMLVGRLYQPVLVAAVGTAGTVYVEFLNYYLYRQLANTRPLQGAITGRTARWLVRQFSRAPFLSVYLAALTPLPYWVVRFLSPLAGYPVSRHLWATALGRFPRLWFFAALGVWWRVDTRILFAITALSIAVACAVWAAKHEGRASRPERSAHAIGTRAVGVGDRDL